MSAPELDVSVDVAALFKDPTTTLLPVLSCLPGWDQVQIVTAALLIDTLTHIQC